MKILIAYPSRSSFVARDINILASRHDVSEHHFYSLSPANLLRGIRAVAQADLLFLWFASLRALPLVLFARLLGKTVVTVVGGYEAANCPEINYGNARFWRQKKVTRWILFRSRSILTVSASSQQEIINNLGIAAARLTLIHHGFDDYAPAAAVNKAKSVLTVGLLSDVTWTRKGVYE
ncbi:MAG: glycosyltransferase, partial [Candidatus Zixiibacteriota bacterium]